MDPWGKPTLWPSCPAPADANLTAACIAQATLEDTRIGFLPPLPVVAVAQTIGLAVEAPCIALLALAAMRVFRRIRESSHAEAAVLPVRFMLTLLMLGVCLLRSSGYAFSLATNQQFDVISPTLNQSSAVLTTTAFFLQKASSELYFSSLWWSALWVRSLQPKHKTWSARVCCSSRTRRYAAGSVLPMLAPLIWLGGYASSSPQLLMQLNQATETLILCTRVLTLVCTFRAMLSGARGHQLRAESAAATTTSLILWVTCLARTGSTAMHVAVAYLPVCTPLPGPYFTVAPAMERVLFNWFVEHMPIIIALFLLMPTSSASTFNIRPRAPFSCCPHNTGDLARDFVRRGRCHMRVWCTSCVRHWCGRHPAPSHLSLPSQLTFAIRQWNPRFAAFMLLLGGSNALLMLYGLLTVSTGRGAVAGLWLGFARGCAYAAGMLDFPAALLLQCHGLLSGVRYLFPGHTLPFNEVIPMHKQFAGVGLALSLLHTVAHVMASRGIAAQYVPTTVVDVCIPRYASFASAPLLGDAVASRTGLIMLIGIGIGAAGWMMRACLTKAANDTRCQCCTRQAFEWFLYLHWVFAVLLVGGYLLHGWGCLLTDWPLSFLPTAVVTVVSIADWAYRACRRYGCAITPAVHVGSLRQVDTEAASLVAGPQPGCLYDSPFDVDRKGNRQLWLVLQFCVRPGVFESGNVVKLRCPQLSRWQYHPFTLIVRNPAAGSAEVHITPEPTGWTGHLRQRLSNGGSATLDVGVPMGAACLDFDATAYTRAVIVFRGSGFAPAFASLQRLLSRPREPNDKWRPPAVAVVGAVVAPGLCRHILDMLQPFAASPTDTASGLVHVYIRMNKIPDDCKPQWPGTACDLQLGTEYFREANGSGVISNALGMLRDLRRGSDERTLVFYGGDTAMLDIVESAYEHIRSAASSDHPTCDFVGEYFMDD